MNSMTRSACLGAFLAFSLSAVSSVAQPLFAPPLQLTDSIRPYQLSRNPNSAMAFDSIGTLHITYWSGFFATSPTEPAYVYYQSWTEADGWSTQEFIDDSYYDDGSGLEKFGGRHPTIAVAPDDSVWVAWHDHRHCNPDPPGNGIDNIEIYADHKPFGGSFSSTDLRLTTTNAGHLGDNGYTARVAVAPTGRVSVLWYDFSFDGGVSDIFVKHSDNVGNFNLVETLDDMRLTNLNDRTPGLAYSIPDVTVDSTGQMLAIWTSGFGGAAPVYFTPVPNPQAIVSETTIVTGTGAYFDPAKITTAPNGDVWVFYTRRAGTEQDIMAMKRPFGSSSFESPITLHNTLGVIEQAVDAEVDSSGNLHVVWIDERSGRHIYYGVFDPAVPGFTDELQVTTSPDTYRRVTIQLGDSDRPHILYDVEHSSTSGDVWFVAPQEPAAATQWNQYE